MQRCMSNNKQRGREMRDLIDDGIEIAIGQTESGLYQAISDFADTYRKLWRAYRKLLAGAKVWEKRAADLQPLLQSCKHIDDRDVQALVAAVETLFEP